MRRDKHNNTTIAGSGFHHVAVRTPDWDGSIRFWTQGLGLGVALEWGEAPRRACLLDMGDGNYLELFEREPLENVDAEAPIMHFCLRTDDCDAAVEKARAAGAEVTMEPKEPQPFLERGIKARIAFVKGPGGEVCEFFQSDIL
jgi:glyoxylase I family protein